MFSKNAKWIGLSFKIIELGEMSPALQLRKVIDVEKDKVSDACLSICGLGCYALFINGKRVGDDVLSPAMSDYGKRVLYLTYNVKDYLVDGKNAVVVKLGDGFYNQTSKDTWQFCNALWKNEKRLLLDLKINGESALVSDTSWKASLDGATTHNAIRTGEYYDARKEDDFLSVDYDDSAWQNANRAQPPAGILVEHKLPPMRECEILKPISMHKSSEGFVYDFGRNIAGYVLLTACASQGQTAVIRYAEKLDGKEIDQSNINIYSKVGEFSQDRYTFKDDKPVCWKPEFVYHGFQYIQLSGIENATMDSVSAVFVHTDLTRYGDFSCSNPLLSWIYDAGITSILSCTHGIPEDCPHREKNGWTGDASIASDATVINFDALEYYKKWLADLCDTQHPNGQLCAVAPSSGFFGYRWGAGPAWDSALFTLPDAIYRQSKNTECIQQVYEYAKKYLEYSKYYENDGLVLYGLCDWCAPKELKGFVGVNNKLSDSCYYYKMLSLMSKFATILKKKVDAKIYANRAKQVKDAIAKTYIDGDKVDNCVAGAYAFVIHYDIVEGEQKQILVDKLVEVVTKNNFIIDVGILGIKALLHALSDNGRTDIAYKIVNRYDYPSFGYWKDNGATSLWETWEGKSSRNHQMYSDVLYWMMRNVAGIKSQDVAYKSVVLEPYFFDEECSASATTKTPYGELSFSWKKTQEKFTASVTVPKNTVAILKILDMPLVKLKAGDYDIEL